MKKWIAVSLCAALLAACLCGCGEKTEPFSMQTAAAEIDAKAVSDFKQTDEQTDYVKVTVEDFGELVIRLRGDVAPQTVKNFKSLVADGFYDGLTFHRVYPGFMIQGGDPKGDGTGGSKTSIKGEFAKNGVENSLSHIRGVVSMAREIDNDSASSQFFIMHADSTGLDGSYAAFGYVVAGLSVVDDISKIDLTTNAGGELSQPVTPVVISSVCFVAP